MKWVRFGHVFAEFESFQRFQRTLWGVLKLGDQLIGTASCRASDGAPVDVDFNLISESTILGIVAMTRSPHKP